MIEILRPSPEKLEVLAKAESNCWVNVTNPTPEEIQKLRKIIDIPEDLLVSLKDKEEVPVIDEYEAFTFIIIRAPFNNIGIDLEYYPVPIGIFATSEMVMTVTFFENDTIPKLKSQLFPFRKTQLVFRLLLVSARLYLNHLKEMQMKMYAIEQQLEQSQKNAVIMQFLELEKSLVYFSTSLE